MDMSNLSSPNEVPAHYQPFHREAEELTNSFHARLEDPFNPMAIMLKNEADQLVSDIASNKHPQEVEDRIRTIQNRLRRAGSQDDVAIFTYENNDFFQRRYGRMRDELQRMPGYKQPNPNQGTSGSAEPPRSSEHPGYPPSGGYHPPQQSQNL